MRFQTIAKQGIAICLAAASLGVVGCAGNPSTALTEEQQANRAFMSQVNEAMVELDDNLESFVDAVSRGDVVNMRTQADVAYRSLDKLAQIEAPESLKDVQDSYVQGTDDLKEALDAYIALYTEAQSSKFDWSEYDKRLEDIQALYDKGAKALEAGDKAAAEA